MTRFKNVCNCCAYWTLIAAWIFSRYLNAFFQLNSLLSWVDATMEDISDIAYHFGNIHRFDRPFRGTIIN